MHNLGQKVMVKLFEESVKSPVRRERLGDIKTTKMSNDQVVVQIAYQIRNHGEAFNLHYNEGADHGTIGKPFTPGLRKRFNTG